MTRATLEKRIVATRQTPTPRGGRTVDGYTVRAGAPTGLLVRLEGESRWRRVYCVCFSNVGTCFLRMRGREYLVSDCDFPERGAE